MNISLEDLILLFKSMVGGSLFKLLVERGPQGSDFFKVSLSVHQKLSVVLLLFGVRKVLPLSCHHPRNWPKSRLWVCPLCLGKSGHHEEVVVNSESLGPVFQNVHPLLLSGCLVVAQGSIVKPSRFFWQHGRLLFSPSLWLWTTSPLQP
jgi:hypothetical protein